MPKILKACRKDLRLDLKKVSCNRPSLNLLLSNSLGVAKSSQSYLLCVQIFVMRLQLNLKREYQLPISILIVNNSSRILQFKHEVENLQFLEIQGLKKNSEDFFLNLFMLIFKLALLTDNWCFYLHLLPLWQISSSYEILQNHSHNIPVTLDVLRWIHAV